MTHQAQITEICCRDLRRYLEHALRATHGGVVSVKMRRLLRAELLPSNRVRYSACLRRILSNYRWKGDTYVIPRRDAELLLQNLDSLCAALKNKRKEAQPRRQRQEKRREEVRLIAITLPNDLLRAVDAYAQRTNKTRSEVVREAIHQLIAMYHVLEELNRAKDGKMAQVTLRIESVLLRTLDEYAARLKAPRSAVVRYAVMQMLERLRAT
jgi:metal-responsive CopG/Arc/MetJ family transcriptional regulator